jgi:hypothetical protein
VLRRLAGVGCSPFRLRLLDFRCSDGITIGERIVLVLFLEVIFIVILRRGLNWSWRWRWTDLWGWALADMESSQLTSSITVSAFVGHNYSGRSAIS